MPPKPEVLALIPARGGSKGIPGKNIKLLGGHPLIAYSIAAAHQAEWVSRVVVSTDDEAIAAVAREQDAELPFMRPAAYAQDSTLDLPVFQHALGWFAEQENYHPDIVVQLRPTTPFRPAGMVDEAVRILLEHPEATSVRGVVPSGQNPYKMWRMAPGGEMVPLLESDLDEPYNMPRQKLPPTYWQTGHIDAIRPAEILAGSMSGPVIYPLQIDPVYTVDLDNLLDWERAEWRLKDPALQVVLPPEKKRPLPAQVELVVFDFDGVMTDDRVYVDQEGVEMVAAHRGDGMGVALLRRAGIPAMILSTETNPVVARRAEKLQIPVMHGVGRKGEVLAQVLAEQGINPLNVVYLGNDVNDLPCFPLVGCAVVVADAHPAAAAEADLVLGRRGGDGAVRELCDLLLEHLETGRQV
jgi:N-acylneuraminate cytidylyltransferase